MQGNEFISILQSGPLIAAIKNEDGLKQCLDSECQIVFILYGDIVSIAETVVQLKNAGKLAMVHIDLINGLAARDDVTVDFIAQNTQADGIISTKSNLVRRAKTLGLLAVQRFFVLDSMALANITKQPLEADAIEILPGVMPKVIKRLVQSVGKPVIAGGLIADKEDVVQALGAGAVAVSSTNHEVWFL